MVDWTSHDNNNNNVLVIVMLIMMLVAVIMMMIVIRTMAMKSKWGKEVCSTKLWDRLDVITVIRFDKSSNNL